MRDRTAKWLSSFHTLLYRASRGRVGRRLVDNDMLLLTTLGRTSGKPHTVPLLYLAQPDGGYVVIASWGGRPDHPEWYLNLLAEPAASVQIGSKTHRVTARTADSDERSAWWPRIVEAYSGYADYQSKTSRQIPVIFLDT